MIDADNGQNHDILMLFPFAYFDTVFLKPIVMQFRSDYFSLFLQFNAKADDVAGIIKTLKCISTFLGFV